MCVCVWSCTPLKVQLTTSWHNFYSRSAVQTILSFSGWNGHSVNKIHHKWKTHIKTATRGVISEVQIITGFGQLTYTVS